MEGFRFTSKSVENGSAQELNFEAKRERILYLMFSGKKGKIRAARIDVLAQQTRVTLNRTFMTCTQHPGQVHRCRDSQGEGAYCQLSSEIWVRNQPDAQSNETSQVHPHPDIEQPLQRLLVTGQPGDKSLETAGSSRIYGHNLAKRATFYACQ